MSDQIAAPIAGIDGPPPTTFEEFWPYYLSQHLERPTRILHVAGTLLGLSLAAMGLVGRKPSKLLAAPVVGYGFAWVGHFFIEGNKPATFDYPRWSLQGDLRLLARTFTGAVEGDVTAVREAVSQSVATPQVGGGEQAA